MDKNDLYLHVQKLFRKGMVTLVGSGASCAKGLPTMGKLATEVLGRVGAVIGDEILDEEICAEWGRVADLLERGSGLEQAISAETMPAALGDLIALHASECVSEDEAKAIEVMMRNEGPGEFSRMIAHLSKVDDCPSIITTNYDRLIEVDLALSGVGVDSMFVGHTVGRLDSKIARQEHEYVEKTAVSRRRLRTLSRMHVEIAKPHGSLDWFSTGDGRTYRTDLDFPGPRRVVAPGGSKYKLGYESPFDAHRERANRAINRAESFLVLGYGFNDEHLQTHLKPAFKSVPSLVIAYELTENAHMFLETNSNAVGIERGPTEETSVIVQGGNREFVNCDIWKLDILLREALQI